MPEYLSVTIPWMAARWSTPPGRVEELETGSRSKSKKSASSEDLLEPVHSHWDQYLL